MLVRFLVPNAGLARLIWSGRTWPGLALPGSGWLGRARLGMSFEARQGLGKCSLAYTETLVPYRMGKEGGHEKSLHTP